MGPNTSSSSIWRHSTVAGTCLIAAPAASYAVDLFSALEKPTPSAACGGRLHCGLRWDEGTRRDQRAKTKTCPPKRVNSSRLVQPHIACRMCNARLFLTRRLTIVGGVREA